MSLIRKVIRKIGKGYWRSLKYWVRDYVHIKKQKREANDLKWKLVNRCPAPRYDAGAIQVGPLLYIFGGYMNLDEVLNVVDVLDLKKRKWIKKFPMPQNMPQTHFGMAWDGHRYIYAVSGQLGNQCHPAKADCFVFDSLHESWSSFPPLPEPRYAACAQILGGRLHVVGGSKPDRKTPAVDHWSIAVYDGQIKEKQWEPEPDIPRGGPHRASAVIDNKLYIFGGQEGDWVAIPGDPKFTGTGDLVNEIIYGDTYMFDSDKKQWDRKSDMPVPSSHTDFSVFVNDKIIIIVGGIKFRDSKTKKFVLTDAIQLYNSQLDSWKIIGHLPYRMKHTAVAYYDGWLYISTGQRDKSLEDPSPGAIVDRTWRAKLSINEM